MQAEQHEIWRPNPGPQTQFLACTADEALYGGAAGGGKTDAMLAAPTRWLHHPSFRALILRRTFPELKKSLFDRARELYKGIDPGADFNETDKEWEFSTHAKLFFGHLQHESDVEQYQGSAFQFVGFEELCHFLKKQYLYLFTRARSAQGLPIRIRATANPGGPGHDWVFERWAPWLDRRPEYKGVRAASGEVLWFLPGATNDEPERLLDGGRSEALALVSAWEQLSDIDKARTPRPRSRTFIAAKLSDNPALMRNDPGYADRIRAQDAVTRAQLLDGNWLARAARGVLFKRAWFDIVDAAPAVARRIRFWDRAATADPVNARVAGKKPNTDPDYTVGTKLARSEGGVWFVEDVIRFRGRPQEVEDTIRQTAITDGKGVSIGLWQDPGSAGKFEVDYYVTKVLVGYDVHPYLQVKDKVTYAKPFSAQCEARNVKLVNGSWVPPWLQELEEFPEGGHDDQEDSAAGAFMALNGEPIADPGDTNYPRGERRFAKHGEDWDDD
jgi:predicted phage terminase large subunit-like protein